MFTSFVLRSSKIRGRLNLEREGVQPVISAMSVSDGSAKNRRGNHRPFSTHAELDESLFRAAEPPEQRLLHQLDRGRGVGRFANVSPQSLQTQFRPGQALPSHE